VLDTKRGPFRDSVPCINSYTSTSYEFYIKIDISGNVEIKQKGIFYCSGSNGGITEHGNPMDILSIKDNIPIPTDSLNTIKSLIDSPVHYSPQFVYIVGQIKKIKDDLILKKEDENDKLKLQKEAVDKDLKINELKLQNEILEKDNKELKKHVLKLERNMKMNKMIYNEDTDSFEPE